MYYLKNTLFLELTKNQKASLFSFIKSFVKKHNANNLSVDDILELFIEDEKYYYEQKNPHFEWIIQEFDKDKFLKELKILIKENLKQLELKEAQNLFWKNKRHWQKNNAKKRQSSNFQKKNQLKSSCIIMTNCAKNINWIKKIQTACPDWI